MDGAIARVRCNYPNMTDLYFVPSCHRTEANTTSRSIQVAHVRKDSCLPQRGQFWLLKGQRGSLLCSDGLLASCTPSCPQGPGNLDCCLQTLPSLQLRAATRLVFLHYGNAPGGHSHPMTTRPPVLFLTFVQQLIFHKQCHRPHLLMH